MALSTITAALYACVGCFRSASGRFAKWLDDPLGSAFSARRRACTGNQKSRRTHRRITHSERVYYCALLLVSLALEDGERRALGIGKDGDPASREIQRSSQHATTKLPGLLDGTVPRGDREVRQPERRRVAVLLRHRHEATVLGARVLDRGVEQRPIVLDSFDLPTEEPTVEVASRPGIAGLELVPAHATNVVDPSRTDMLLRLPDAEHSAPWVGEHGHASQPHHVEGLLEYPGAQLPGPRDGLVGARDGDVVVPVRGVLVLLDDRRHRVALTVAHRIDAARDLVVPELPAQQVTVEGLRALRVRGR